MVVIDVIENIYQNQNDGKLCAGDLYHQLMNDDTNLFIFDEDESSVKRLAISFNSSTN